MGIYLGLDSSTQGLKALLIDSGEGLILGEASVNFGAELPQYESPKGFLPNADPLIKVANPLLWADALDLVLAKLAAAKMPLGKVAGISGAGQQHGSVFLNSSFEDALANLDSRKNLPEQLSPCLSREVSPIWMDRSTAVEVAELQSQFGARLQSDTGSPAIERFTGPQIRKFSKTEREKYRKTVHVHLVSSFMCSLFCGKSAAIDYGDGAGMNLLNLKTLQWDGEIASFTAPKLLDKLPPVVAGTFIAGHLSPYFAKYGLCPGIPVAVWTGDNPSSLIGMGAGEPGVAVISLGTSDTFFAAMREFKTDPAGCGHVFGNPQGAFMALICFSNGSLARERIKDECGVDWDFFNKKAGAMTLPGNGGRLILPYFEPESTPLVLKPQVKSNFDTASSAERVRAILESQALSIRLHSGWIGEKFSRIRVTGGASGCLLFRQILADVFQAEIETISISASAALGGALRAANAVDGIPFGELYKKFTAAVECTKSNPANAAIYDDALQRYAAMERGI
ncbi:MAG: hypothetical protein A2X49_09880 [Lentisphaerae bacterium GWF2_52_8]|nr:MAG: hypothetical protein A2X49_09880 [Lentisphaerae bacterium GWF2_52_8]